MKRDEGDPRRGVGAAVGRSHKDRQRISREKVAEIKDKRCRGRTETVQ